MRELRSKRSLALLSGMLMSPLALAIQGQASDDTTAATENQSLEEVTVVGTQIKGAQINDALAVSVINAEDIETLGVDSGDELLALIPENGQNYFNEAENISGGVNSARGDIGAFNLRNLGTGNTLVLLNGRRVVNSAAYQTEEVGGSFVPVTTVNSNILPTAGLQRVEVLRDGASAIYGADAVAGVVNSVLKSDFDGFSVSVKHSEFDNFERDTQKLSIEWGETFNEGRTNVSAFFSHYQRDRIAASEDPRWADADLRERIPENSPWFDDTAFRNNSANSLYPQLDMPSGSIDGITDSRGELETYPVGDERCEYAINQYVCGAVDGQGTERYNLNEFRDVSSELERSNLFVFLNHDLGNGMESFSEFGLYRSATTMSRHPTASFSTSELLFPAENPYNPFGEDFILDNYRFAELPRIVENDGDNFRLLQGLRGDLGDWEWETAVLWNRDEKTDVTRNRVSNTLMQEALNDTTEAAYNPLSGGVDSNIERALIDVRRDSESELKSFDVKFSNNGLFSLPAGPVAALAGFEIREESFVDDRDDRLDGTIQFTDQDGDTYPFVSDVVNSSPTPDNSGERTVTSLFGELQVPVFDNFDMQLALRHEDFSDFGDATVGKVAFGYRPVEQLLLRGSWSEAFRAPNLVTINEEIIARNSSTTDWACVYAAENGGDPDQDVLDCSYSIQRIAQGSDELEAEQSTNTSLGLVFTPLDSLTVTVDYWSIEKEDTIGLFGEENHTLLDLYYRLQNGTANCGSVGNTAVSRGEVDPDEAGFYEAAGICAAGSIDSVNDRYANLDTRTLAGYDVGIYYDLYTDIGEFGLKYNGSFTTQFEQDAGGDAAVLVQAQQNGDIPVNYPVAGFADLIGKNGNQEERHSVQLNWRYDQFGASLSGFRIGDFYQDSLTLEDGTRYVIPSMTTYDATVDYRFDYAGASNRVRFGVKNLTDERAPLADRYFGYFSDAHSDYGRYYYLSLKSSF
ncbi:MULTISPECIES: TonB-dependent receptor domain-containing protein [unclassified Microbulbifer]|uniref:TonB-dependent receptor domain-containing protein n=1 Tax=unclassified Microbulbifer TaxID=2619833 RepID=UPI001E32280A|nr:TonB-dependent receptor [Microbulbifer sp. YPW16]UHQ54133.1 TonB-dependent receptor [Microbulbifer sp. YPW16]